MERQIPRGFIARYKQVEKNSVAITLEGAVARGAISALLAGGGKRDERDRGESTVPAVLNN